MRIGLIGPAGLKSPALTQAISLLLGEFGVDQVVYLGADGALDVLAEEWTAQLGGSANSSFDDRALELAMSGTPGAIRGLLEAEAEVRRLDALRVLPPPPARTVEMLDDRFVLFVHDKAALDEDDIANAQVIVYSNSKQMLFRRFGPRAFFTPGPLGEGQVGIIETDVDGRLTITAMTLTGKAVLQESLAGRASKVSVTG
jgi:hypothetical protein